MRGPWAGEVDNILELYDQMADVAERRDVMTGTSAPWYWRDPECDHWAVGLVALSDGDVKHYALPGKRQAACGQVEGLKLLFGPQVVTCRECCIVARDDRNVIDQRHVQPVIKSHDRVNFIRREQQRKLHG